MKTIVALVCLFALVSAEAPLEKPKGVYFIAPRPVEPVNLEKATEEVMAQLKSQEGADSGEYHVYLPDGKLQKVQYTTAPIKTAEEPIKPFILVSQQQPNLAFKVEPIYFDATPKSSKLQAEEQTSGYVASIQYTDVKPITGPVYSYKPEPLTRVVRYAPRFQ